MKNALLLVSLACAALTGCFANSGGGGEDCLSNADGSCDAPPSTLPANTTCGEATCDQVPPACSATQVPLVDQADGCYTGACVEAASCDVAPACDLLNTEAQCGERVDCEAVFGGLNCRDPQGNACDANGQASSCTCESFVFARCAAA